MIPNTPEAWSVRADLGTTPWAAALWSRQGQHARFHNVVKALEPQTGETLLDYGCGPGNLCENIPQGVQYLGYDWSTGMIERCERDHAYHDFTRIEPHGPFDLIACIGPFNLPDNWSQAQTRDKLGSLWLRTKRVLVACLYAGQDEDCLIYDKDEVFSFAASLGQASVTQHLPNDLLMVVRR